MPETLKAYIGLGSNLADPLAQVKRAMRELNELPGSRVSRQSRLYRSAPMGPPDQPDYINAVVELETTLTADELLSQLQMLEERHQRIRKQHWGPRTLDLDLLLYGDCTIDNDTLKVPHPGLTQRNFVLLPLFEIAPQLILPDNQPLSEWVQRCSDEGLQCLENI
jgi:2-amino-4-hydroxy-6-hydroxymethyldihydropteridine diphosphokinase